MGHNRIARLAMAILASILTSAPAQSQDNVWTRHAGTIKAEFHRTDENGAIQSCQLGFRVLALDSTSGQKLPMQVSGTITFANFDKDKPALLLVVAVSDIDPATGDQTPDAPIGANIAWQDKTSKTAFLSTLPPRRPGGYYAIFKPQPTFGIVMSGLGSNAVQLILTRTPNGKDVPVVIDPTVVDTVGAGERKYSDSVKKDFYACYTDFLNATYFKNGVPPELREEMEKRSGNR
jgi:hypothetical protein